ncbi:unnamed protein product [Auanema sp. JU1783]|nr:unnamed protein product [Auanema sp. JU1783]
MIGWTHICIGSLIIRRYGEDTWRSIKLKAGYEEDTEFEVQVYYDDSETMRIFRTAAGVLGLSVDDMWEMYGEFLVTYSCETGWQKMLSCMANNLQEFLDNLNSMHYFIDQIAFKSEMRGPTFHCETSGDNSLRLHYFSNRQGLFPIVKGLVRKVSRVLYDMEVNVNVVERVQERRKTGLVEHVVFSLEPDTNHKAGSRLAYKFRNESKNHEIAAADKPVVLSPITLFDIKQIFPYHICFNKQMVIEHVGSYLLQEYRLVDRKMLKLTELVQLVQPSDIQLTFKNITQYLNTIFIFQIKHHSRRNEIEETSTAAFQQPLCLKGQMSIVNSGNSIMYYCSPYVTTVRDILELNLYISDMPMHDATRDLVMLNQSRICQMELNKKLDETVKNLRALADTLQIKKTQTDVLLYDLVPRAVADTLRQNKNVTAQEFSDCTVIFSELPDFFTLNINCTPAEVVTIISDLFHEFDRLIEKYKVYKVLSLMDSYLIVGGVPNPCPLHCETMLNLALAMVFEGKQIITPKLNLPLRVRIGVHCGPVVAGVVSQKKPRYCVLGQTVQVAKLLCSQSQPGKVMISNAVRTNVTKHLKSVFIFTPAGCLDSSNSKIFTHYLEKNEKLSAWDLIDKEKNEHQTIDGYKELHCDADGPAWEHARIAAVKQQKIVDAFRDVPSRTNRAVSRLRSLKKNFRAAQSNDSGISVDVRDNEESAICSIM